MMYGEETYQVIHHKPMNIIGKIPATTQDVETAVEHAVEKLALMINEGFTTTATKDDLTALEGKLTTRLDRIEHLLLAKQAQRLNDLEARMKKLEDALAVSPTCRPASAESRLSLRRLFSVGGRACHPGHLSPIPSVRSGHRLDGRRETAMTTHHPWSRSPVSFTRECGLVIFPVIFALSRHRLRGPDLFTHAVTWSQRDRTAASVNGGVDGARTSPKS
jgi:hypothetical protein